MKCETWGIAALYLKANFGYVCYAPTEIGATK